MRYVIAVVLLLLAADRNADRDALLAADRALSDQTAAKGMTAGLVPVLNDDAAFLYPGAPLLRGSATVQSFLASADSIQRITWSPAFADVSADGKLGYSYGWTKGAAGGGKYLACWQRVDGAWRLSAYAMSPLRTGADSVNASTSSAPVSAQVRGRAEARELMDAAFAAMSVASGAKLAFLAYAAEHAISFGGGPRMTEGRQAIGAAFDEFPAGAVLQWSPVAAYIAPSGDLGCTVGNASIPSLKHYSKYLTIWQRQADGGWKFVADGGNVRPAPPASGSPPPED
jgi:ketosteroid isomerase-like protein